MTLFFLPLHCWNKFKTAHKQQEGVQPVVPPVGTWVPPEQPHSKGCPSPSVQPPSLHLLFAAPDAEPEDGEAVAQVAQRHCGCFITGSVPGHVGRGPEQPDLGRHYCPRQWGWD